MQEGDDFRDNPKNNKRDSDRFSASKLFVIVIDDVPEHSI